MIERLWPPRIELPWPPSILNPNDTQHWRKKAKAIKEYRGACKAIARAYKPRIKFTVIIHPPDNRRRDIQNTIGALKPHIDGLQDAWGIDDSKFIIQWPSEYSEVIKGGKIFIK